MKNQILIVDDHQSFLNGLLKALKTYCNYPGEVKAVESGEKAINEAHSNFYDICFLDINLPGISGLDVMEKMREISPETKVVIMTASYLDDDQKEKIEETADLFIPKPVDLNIIKDFINRELKMCKVNHGNCNTTIREKRELPRIPYEKKGHCSISVFYNWELRSDLEVYVIDLNNNGAGINALYPLYPGNVLRFHDSLSNKSGIVKWSIDKKNHYRVGIKFI